MSNHDRALLGMLGVVAASHSALHYINRGACCSRSAACQFSRSVDYSLRARQETPKIPSDVANDYNTANFNNCKQGEIREMFLVMVDPDLPRLLLAYYLGLP